MMASPAIAPTLEATIIKTQEEEIKQLWAIIEIMQKDFADHARRLRALEGESKESPRAANHLDVLYDTLITSGQRGMTYPQIASILKITARRVRQLKPYIEEDNRFIVVRHPTRTNSHIICLKKVRM